MRLVHTRTVCSLPKRIISCRLAECSHLLCLGFGQGYELDSGSLVGATGLSEEVVTLAVYSSFL